jgi:RNA polymerase sigma factor (sigma-70 family)
MNEILLHKRHVRPMTANKTGSSVHHAQTLEETSSPHSFDEQFLTYWPVVYRVLVRLVGDPAEAEDLALETFLRLYQRPPAPVAEGLNLGGWLHRVATNLGLHSIRSFKRREQYELAAGKGALEGAVEDHPAEILAGKEDHRLARLALAQMNERQAGLLVMRYSGMAYKEIAAELGVSATSIGPLLFRAEREFEKRYRTLNGDEP